MKIDKIKLKRSVNDLPQTCRDVIQLFKTCSDEVLLAELQQTLTWNFGKSELYHWIDVLNRFDQILSDCTQLPPENPLYEPENIYLVPDITDPQRRELVLQILSFTALLIENANARHTYYSMEHLIALLTSNNLDVVLASLNVIFVFSKRCHYIIRLPRAQKIALTNRLIHLAESMGGKESGFGLCKLSTVSYLQHFPVSATSVHFEFARQSASEEFGDGNQTIQLDNLYNFAENPQQILQHILKTVTISRQKQSHLLYRIQRAMHFPNFHMRCQCIEAQLMAKSILIYSGFVPDFIPTSVEQGLIEELVELLEVESDDDITMKLKAACFRNLTALLQQEREPRSCPIINKIITALHCQNYYGFLASLVRKIIISMTEMNLLLYSQSFITTLFSFLYHMAINETSATALIASGHIEFLVKVISWKTDNPLNVSLVTRAVRVIDLLSTLDIQPTQAKSICDMLFERLEMEMKICRRDAPHELPAVNPKYSESKETSPRGEGDDKEVEDKDVVKAEPMELEEPQCIVTYEQLQQHLLEMRQSSLQCLPQRSALIKSLLNFFKKAASDLLFPETLRNLCESPLLPHLKHIISNVEYYGPTLYLPATEIVTNHILNEPSHLTPLQMTGLPGVVLNSLLLKPIPPTVDILTALPNMLSALCLNERGLNVFLQAQPFDRLFSILLSPEYLNAMRKRKNLETNTTGFDATPAVLGTSIDQLMRHQPKLKNDVFDSLIKLLDRILDYGTDTDYIVIPYKGDSLDDEMSYFSEEVTDVSSPTVSENVTLEKSSAQAIEKSRNIPLIDYILNVVKFISHIIATKSYNDDHLNEFQQRGGISLLLKILCMPNLPLEFSNSFALATILSSIKQIVEFMKNPQDILETILSQHLAQLLDTLSPLYETSAIGLKSVLMSCSQTETMVSTHSLLHKMCMTQHFISLLANLHKTNNDARILKYLSVWVKDDNIKLILKQLSFLHNSLFWESALLLNEPVTPSSLITATCPAKERERLIPDNTIAPVPPPDNTNTGSEVTVERKPPCSVIKKLKPCFHVIRHLGSNLTDLFTHLVRFACNTPGIKNKINRNSKVYLHENCVEMVKVLIEILKEKLLWQPDFQDSKYGRDILHLVRSCLIISSSNFLFDERKQPYLLMLSEFQKADGFHTLVQLYEESFRTITLPCQDPNTLVFPTISCDKWLSAWLNFVEKLLNITLVLNSQNIILPFKPTPSDAQNPAIKCYQFEPVAFLIDAQQIFIQPLKDSWKLLNNLSCSGSLALLEPHLTLLCGIIQGENVLRERLELVSKKSTAPAPVVEVFSPNLLHVDKLTEMGFTKQHANKALESCNNNIAQALDWIMNHPEEVAMEGLTEDDQMAKAIALSLDGQPNEEPQEAPIPKLLSLREDPDFISDVIACSAQLLKKIPQAVYRIVPLFTVITENWGPSYIEPSLYLIFKEFHETAVLLQETPLHSPVYQQLYSLVLLLIFLFENLTLDALSCTSGSPLQDHCINLFDLAVQQLESDPATTIEWLSPLILFIDLLEKHSLIIMHKEARPKEQLYWSWQNSGRWTHFLQANNKLINKAFSEGDPTATVSLEKGNRYVINFDNMIMRGLEPHAHTIPVRYSKLPDAPKEDSPAPTSSDSEIEVVSKNVPDFHGDHIRELASALALNYDQKVRLITSCATILQFVKNTSLLQAVLQLSIRLTRDYRIALIFGECKGYVHLFSFKKDMLFSGFQALVSILIRHLFESENALRYMMESAMRISHHYPSPAVNNMPYRMGRRGRNSKDLDSLFRPIGPIYNKHPEIFMEIAKEIFRLDESDHQQLFTQDSKKSEVVKLLPRKKPCTTLDNSNQETFIRDLLELLYQGNDPADSTPATNPLLSGATLPFDPLFSRSSNVMRLARNRLHPFDRLHGNSLRGDPLRSFHLHNMMDIVDEDMDIDELSEMQSLTFQMPSPHSATKANPSEQAIVSKSGILRLLAELVTSYPMCAITICQEKLPPNGETTALTYILDNLVHESKVAKSFLRTIGGLPTSNFPDVQILLITELKQSIIRVSQMPECQLKHVKLRALLGLINAFLVVPGKEYTLNIAKLMVKRNFASDIAKILHSMDLNSPDLAETANNIVRTIEALTKLLYKTPGHQNQIKKPNKTTTDVSRADQPVGPQTNTDPHPTTSNGDQASNSDPIELAEATNTSGDATLIEHGMEDPSYNEEMMMIELSNIRADVQETDELYLTTSAVDNPDETDSDSSTSDHTGGSESDESMDDTEDLREDPDNCNSAGEELDNYDGLDETVVGEHLDANDVRLVISLGASQSMGADDLHPSSVDDDTSTDLNVTSPHDITEDPDDPDNTAVDDLDDNDDDQPHSDVLLGSSSSNDENVEIHDDVEIESDVSQDSEAETEEMSEVVTIMGQSFDYDSSADLEDLDLQDDLFPILRRQYSFNRNMIRESLLTGIPRTNNSNRIPAHPLLNRQTNRPPHQPPQQPPPSQSSYSLRVSDPQSVLQLVSSSRSTTLPEPGNRPLAGQWRRLVLEQDQLVFEEDPMLHKEHTMESQDNEDEGFIPMCNLRIHQEDGILGSCHNFQSIKKAQEEIATFLKELNEKEKQKQKEAKEKSENIAKEKKEEESLKKETQIPQSSLEHTIISPPPLPLPEGLPLSNISIPSPSEPVANLLEPAADQPSLPTQLPADSPLLFNQFDGSQLSARQTLQQIDSNHPLYTFFSAVAGHPPPPNPLIPISSSSTAPPTSLPADTSIVQLTTPPTVTALDRPREGPAGDTSHIPPDTNLPLSHPIPLPLLGNSNTAGLPELPAANIFTPITPIYPYQELSEFAPPAPLQAPTTSEEPTTETNSQTGQENPVPPTQSGPTLIRRIDPDFLAAIPEPLRAEIIREQQELRTTLERGRTSAAPNASSRQRHELDHVHGEISTEVLAEMPADIQDEIISQRRIEQQRQNLANADDPISFLDTLPRALRQNILNEMDDETFGNLPSDVQEEATHRYRPRHRDYGHMFESRHMLTDPSMHPYDLLSIPSPTFYLRRFDAHNIIPPYGMSRRRMLDTFTIFNSDPTNKPPLDFEALTCLLSVLFLDSSKIQRSKYNQLIRLLCEHKETKNWILSILTYFLADINQVAIPNCSVQTTPPIVIQINQSNTGQYTVKEEPMVEDQHKTLDCISITPQPKKKSSSWMSITQTCGSGLQNILHLDTPSGKGSKPAQLLLHSQAQTTLNNNIVDAFLQLFTQTSLISIPPQNRRETVSMISTYFLEPTNSALLMHSKFWECLIKLESSHVNVKGKASNRTHMMLPNLDENANGPPLVHMIINLLECENIRSNQSLLDKFIKLLWNICQNLKPSSTTKLPQNPSSIEPHPGVLNVEIPNLNNLLPDPVLGPSTEQPVPLIATNTGDKKEDTAAKPESQDILFSNDEVNSIIGLLSSKSCDDQSLNNVNELVMKLAKYHRDIMKHIYSTLVSTSKQLALELESELKALKDELVAYNTANPISPEEAKQKANKNPLSFYTSDQQKLSKSYHPDLHLQSMYPFLSKPSNVSLFLRMLKIIQSLRREIQKLYLVDDTFDWDNAFEMPPQHSAFRDRLGATMRIHVQELTQRSDQVAEQIQGYMQLLNEDPDAFDDNSLRLRTEEIRQAMLRRQEERGVPSSSRGKRDPADQTFPTYSIRKRESERLSQVLNMTSLWALLENCLEELAKTCHDHAVLVMQNMVECFFIVHAGDRDFRNIEDTDDTDIVLSRYDREGSLASLSDLPNDSTQLPASPSRSISSQCHRDDPDMLKFLKFAERHRVVLNQILRQTTTPLSSGTFSILIDHTRLLDFDVKREYFRQELESSNPHSRREDTIMQINRKNVFEDSFRQLSRKTPEEMKNKLYVIFKDEDGQDAGGLLREWYLIVSREIFNPDYALFTTTPGDKVTYVPNSCSFINHEHLDYFKFVGRLIAKAIYDNKLLDCYFGRSFYKHILSKPVQYTDLESEDYGFYKSMVYLMEHDLNEIGCELSFSTEIEEFGKMEIKDLVKNGRNLPVTEENKKDYVRLVCQMKMTGAIHQQIKSFLEGFYEIIPKKLISIFNEQELELLISGLPNVDIDDLKANTEYYKYNESSIQIQWFWRALRSFEQADRAKFLQFVTGTSKVPLRGFAYLEGMNGSQKFQIHKDERSDMRLPSAHTCFNQLDLPAYSSYEDLRSNLLYASQECPEGFGLA